MNDMERPIIAITGSNGKTTTKEMIASILKQRWNTFKSYENGNDVWFLRKYAQEINDTHQAIVLEYALYKSNSIRECCQVIQPNIAVVTSIGHERMGSFGSLEKIAKEKSQLIHGTRKGGLIYINADDPGSQFLEIHEVQNQLVRVGLSSSMNLDYAARDLCFLEKGMSFNVHLNNQYYPFYIPVWGKHNVINALFAIGVTHRLGLNIKDIQQGLKHYEKPYHRLWPYYVHNALIIDDSFNASPESMKAAIDILTIVGKGIKIAVLGSMPKLGDYSMPAHQDLGHYVATQNIDYLVTYGNEEAQFIYDGAIKAGFSKNKIAHCFSRNELNQHLLRLGIQYKDDMKTILFKGANELKLYKSVWYLIEKIRLKIFFDIILKNSIHKVQG